MDTRVVNYRTSNKKRTKRRNEAEEEDRKKNGIPRYEEGLDEQRRKSRYYLNLGLCSGLQFALICILIVCGLEFAMQYVQTALEEHLGFSRLATGIISTISVLLVTELITAMLAKLFPGFLSLSEAIAKLCRFFTDGFLAGTYKKYPKVSSEEVKKGKYVIREDYNGEASMKDSWQNRYVDTDEWKRYKKLIELCPKYFTDGLLHIVTDENKVNEYYRLTGKQIGVVYESDYHYMVVDLVYEGQGEPEPDDPRMFTFERLLPKVPEGAVVIVPKYCGKYVLLSQYRHALRTSLIAFPRGFGEKGISAEDNILKELSEELGVSAVRNVRSLGYISPDAGAQGTMAEVFFCDVDRVEKKKGYEEIEDLLLMDDGELKEAIRQGRIVDGYTLAAYSLVQLDLEKA